MEASGYRWFNDNGTQQDVLQILKDHGMNTIRLRVWVNPSGGWNGVNDVVAKALRARNAGFRIMIDFHYSDSWADPGKQTKPAAWRTHTFDQLMADVYSAHLQHHEHAGRERHLSGVGAGRQRNQQRHVVGGRARLGQHAQLRVAGEQRLRRRQGREPQLEGHRARLQRLRQRAVPLELRRAAHNGARWDIIGMSLYPEPNNWQTLVSQTITNINDMRSRYGKGVMIVEVGMSLRPGHREQGISQRTSSRARAMPAALGVLYWEPQAYNWQGYTKGAWNTNGRPTIALDAFIEGVTAPATARQRHAAGKPHRLLRRRRHHRQQPRGLHGQRLREHQQRHGHYACAGA